MTVNVDWRSSRETNPFVVEKSGRGLPAGGIVPACSRRTTFSHVDGSSLTSSRFALSRRRPAVFSRSLWQRTQYLLSRARSDDGAIAAAVLGACRAELGVCALAWESAQALVEHCRDELVPGPYVQGEQELRATPDSRYTVVNRLMSDVLAYLTRAAG